MTTNSQQERILSLLEKLVEDSPSNCTTPPSSNTVDEPTPRIIFILPILKVISVIASLVFAVLGIARHVSEFFRSEQGQQFLQDGYRFYCGAVPWCNDDPQVDRDVLQELIKDPNCHQFPVSRISIVRFVYDLQEDKLVDVQQDTAARYSGREQWDCNPGEAKDIFGRHKIIRFTPRNAAWVRDIPAEPEEYRYEV